MSKTEIPPKGYKAFNISQPHIDHLGPGFYKKEDDDQLVLGFYVREEHLNGYGSAPVSYTHLTLPTILLV